MALFIVDRLKKQEELNPNGNSFIPPQNKEKYDDKIAQLNSLGADQYSKINTATINRMSRTSTDKTLAQSSTGNTIVPGSK